MSMTFFLERRWLFAIGLILLLGAFLRLYDLNAESYWSDEMYTVYEVQQTIPQVISSGRLDQPPGYYIPFHFWVQIFGLDETGTRSFSALAGFGSIFIIYLAGRELFGREVGLLSAFLMAISEFQIYYSQTARFYSLFEFTTLLSFLFFILALRSKKIIHYVLNAAAGIFMVYSTVFGVFVLVAQNLFFFLQWKKYKEMTITWLVCQVSILLAMIPYFYPLLFGKGGMEEAAVLNIGNIPVPSLLHPFYAMYRFILPFRREGGWDIVFASYAAAGILLLAGLWVHAGRQGMASWITSMKDLLPSLKETPDLSEKLLLLSFWLLFPILLPFLISIGMIPIYKVYYTISAAPALYLLLAFGIVQLRRVVPVMLSVGVLLTMILPGLGDYYLTAVNLQVKEAAEYVQENPMSADVVVFVPDGDYGFQNDIEQKLFDWYYAGDLPGCSLLGKLVEITAISDALTQCVSGFDRFWVIIPDNRTEAADRYKSFFVNLDERNMRLMERKQFVGLFVYLVELEK